MIIFDKSVMINENTLYTYTYYFKPNSSSRKNDGCIGYGRTIANISVTAWNEDGTNVTTALISGSPTVNSNIVYIKYKYPTGWSVGKYKVLIDITLDNNETDRGIHENVFVESS